MTKNKIPAPFDKVLEQPTDDQVPCLCCASRRVVRTNNYTSSNVSPNDDWITFRCLDCGAVGTGFTPEGAWKSMKKPQVQFIQTVVPTPPWVPPERLDQNLESKWRDAIAEARRGTVRRVGGERLGIEPYFSLTVGREPTEAEWKNWQPSEGEPAPPKPRKAKPKLSAEALMSVVPFVLDPDDDDDDPEGNDE